jgi:hypothetical protein
MPTWYSPTLYRRQVFTDAMLTFCEHTMGGVCADVNAELVEFNGEATCSLWRIHPQWRFPCWLNDSKAAPLTRSGASSPVCVSAPARAATSARPPTSPSLAEARRCRSSSNTSTDKPDHPERRTTPHDTRDGLTPH